MSFLAQLHAQQKTTPSSHDSALQLYYLLRIKDAPLANALPLLELHLVVAESSGDTHEDTAVKIKSGKPYSPQHQHLSLPPAFIQNADKAILQYLLANPTQAGWPPIKTQVVNTFWQELCSSERVYLQHHVQAIPMKISSGTVITSTLDWQQLPNGTQQLLPQATDSIQLFQGYDELTVFALNAKPEKMDITLCDLTVRPNSNDSSQPLTLIQEQEIITTLKALNYSLIAEDIPQFLDKYSNKWAALKLPLPSLASATPLDAQVRGGILCDNIYHNGKNTDVINLNFVYISKHYCTWFNENDSVAHYVVLNDALFYFQRKPELEKAFKKQFTKSCKPFDLNTVGFSASQDVIWQQFFLQEKITLDKSGFIFRIDNNFKRHYIQTEGWLSELTKSSSGFLQVDLFLQVHNENGDKENINLLALLDQIQQYNLSNSTGDIQLTLNDGRIILMPGERLISLTEEFGDLLTSGRGSLSFHPNQQSRLQQLETLLPENSHWQGDIEALDISRQLKQPPTVVEQADCGVNATLRPYQWLGVCWVQHLKNCGVNGLLADDMGLGKTLQTISHLSLEFANNPKQLPALVVMPTSLLHNWLNECTKFAPHLKVLIHHGTSRKMCYDDQPHHILLTSYQLIINDATFFEKTEFSWLILDEAQNIKNPRTKTHMAIKNVQAQNKLCLSGTPVENNLVELWALLNFLMPNCLGNLNDFKFHYQKPIEQDGNSKKMEQLLKRISPFMLRRTKQAVAKDLPKKTEILQTIDLGEQQTQFYESIKNNTWQELQQSLEGTENQGEQQLFVLSALLKLRQACCDPALLGDASIPSAKRQHCIEMATELAAEGRGILIFSQFTTMLDILAEDLKRLGISYGLLTGKTQKRQDLVDKFQAGEFPVFLISLKAGGVGLNLTRADTVIHYDPWWNSAAEQQATDRAHRIGQKNAVFVYKLIAENTIEEKIAALQARKAELGNTINNQAQQTGAKFSMKLEELLSLWAEEK